MAKTQPHDALFKAAFTEIQHAVAHLRAVLPADVVERLDLSSLAVVPGSFVDDALRSRHADILYRASLGRRQVLIYVLQEHQSTVDALMAFRALRYMVRIWDAHLAAHPKARRLPPIIAVVVHHGATGWRAAVTFEELLDMGRDDFAALAAYVPRFGFVLDDLTSTSDAALRSRAATAFGRLVLWALKHAHAPASVLDGFAPWAALLEEMLRAPNGQAAFEALFRYILQINPELSPEGLKSLLAEAAGPEVEEAAMNGVERLLAEGREQGREQGLRQGRHEMLSKLLLARFGALDGETGARLDGASAAELEAWALRVLSATSLADVFASPKPKARPKR